MVKLHEAMPKRMLSTLCYVVIAVKFLGAGNLQAQKIFASHEL